MSVPRLNTQARAALLLLITWSLWLPLRDILAYPDRVSVLPNLQTDAAAYHAIASELEATRRLDALPPRHPPGWVALLALVYSVTGPSFVAAKVVSWVALLVSVAACAYLARRVYGPLAGWIAALLCASSPALRGYVGTVQYEVLTAAGLLVTLVLAVDTVDGTMQRALYRRAAWTGVAGGLLILTRETFAVIVPLVALWMASRVRPSSGTVAARLVAAIVIALAMAPAVAWSGIQSVRYGGLITISEKGPIVIDLGNNPLANGTYNAPLVGIAQPTGLAFVRSNPARSVVLAGRKVLYFWGILRDGWNVPRPTAVWLWRATTGLVPLEFFGAFARGGWLLGLFVVSLWMLGGAGIRTWWALPAIVLMLMAIHVAVLSSHRFAVPILPVVFVLVSGPLAVAATRLVPILRSRAVLAALGLFAAVVVAMQYQAWPLRVHYAAVELDGLEADNRVDEMSGQPVRAADARRGLRPVVLLTDEALPRGPLSIQVRMRRTSEPAAASLPAARMALTELDGRVACARDVEASDLAADRFETLVLPCRLTHDAVVTFAIYATGATDLAVADVALTWNP